MIRFLLVLLLVIAPYSGARFSAQGPKKHSAMTTRTVEKKGVKLEVSLPATSVAGTEIPCKVSLTNTSNEVFDYEHRRKSNYRQFQVVVRNERGDIVPYTAFGNHVLAGEMLDGSSVVKQLTKGSVLTHQYNLSRLFDLTIPGKYRISVQRVLNEEKQKNDQLVIELPVIEFDVSEPSK